MVGGYRGVNINYGTGPSKEEIEQRQRDEVAAREAAAVTAYKNRPRFLDRMGNALSGVNGQGDDVNPAVMLGLAVNTSKQNPGPMKRTRTCLLYTSPSPRD